MKFGRWCGICLLIMILQPSHAEALAGDVRAVVDVTYVIRRSSRCLAALKRLEGELKNRLDKIQSAEQSIQDTLRKLHDSSLAAGSCERKLLERTLASQRALLSREIHSFEREYHRRQDEERSEIDSSIRKVVREIALENGYGVVFDTRAVVYSAEVADISDEVVRRLGGG